MVQQQGEYCEAHPNDVGWGEEVRVGKCGRVSQEFRVEAAEERKG